MVNFFLGIFLCVCLAKCSVDEACRPNSNGEVFKFCNGLTEKPKK